jgi:acetyltransferase-like isoleucine patch superfamily enzyme
MFKQLIVAIKRKYIGKCSNVKKIAYLRKLGAKVGDGTRFNCDLSLVGSEAYLVEIGENCLFAGEVKIFTHDGGIKVINELFNESKRMDKAGRIKIGNNCFLGYRTIILPNVSIGNNCIIGAGSIVSKNIPDNSVAAGVPAKVICTIDEYYEKCKSQLHPTVGMSKADKKKYYDELYK